MTLFHGDQNVSVNITHTLLDCLINPASTCPATGLKLSVCITYQMTPLARSCHMIIVTIIVIVMINIETILQGMTISIAGRRGNKIARRGWWHR